MSDSAIGDAELERILGEDVRYGDLTTTALAIGALPGTISFSARTAMTVCGVEEAARMLSLAGCFVSRICEPFPAQEACQVHDITRFP